MLYDENSDNCKNINVKIKFADIIPFSSDNVRCIAGSFNSFKHNAIDKFYFSEHL